MSKSVTAFERKFFKLIKDISGVQGIEPSLTDEQIEKAVIRVLERFHQ